MVHFSVSHGSTLLIPYAAQLCQKPAGRSYIVHMTCFALQCREGFIAKKDEGRTSSVSWSEAVHMLTSQNYTVYVPQKQSTPAFVMLDAVGGSGTQTLPIYTCPLTSCVRDVALELPPLIVMSMLSFTHWKAQCPSFITRGNVPRETAGLVMLTIIVGKWLDVVHFPDFQEDILFVNAEKTFSL